MKESLSSKPLWKRKCGKCWAIIKVTNPYDKWVCICGWSGYWFPGIGWGQQNGQGHGP